ncbi:MAG: adenylyl-sulfate kinase [Acidimicrobiales bacterium]
MEDRWSTPIERRASTDVGGSGPTIWFTGLLSAVNTTPASAVADRLRRRSTRVEVLDGDVVRTHLTSDLGFSREDRRENVRRIGFVVHLLSRNGVVVVCALISPRREDRDEVRSLHGSRFFEVYVSAPVEGCAELDVSGLYARQRVGTLRALSGNQDPYEATLDREGVVPSQRQTVDQSVDQIWRALSAS